MVVCAAGCKADSSSPPAEAKPSEPPPPTPTPAPEPSPEDPYRDDIARICDVLALSGADQLAEAERMVTVASWLGANLVTDASRAFLVALQKEPEGAKKSGILRTEAEVLGLPPCKLAESWN